MFDQVVRFSYPTTFVFGCGAIRQLPACLGEVGVRKPLLVTDPGLRKSDVFPVVATAFERSGQNYAVFADVHPNPIEEDVERAAQVYRDEKCDGVVGLGGGSPLDVAKAVAVRVTHDGPLADYEAQAGGWQKITADVPPVITIPTTAGTGSEVGRSAVITIPALGRKIVIFSPHLMPKRAIADPELTVDLPPHLTAATGMDAFTHNIESLTSTEFQPVCDAVALGGIELVVKYLERATRNGQDIEARGYMMIAAMMGAMAFQKDLGATHSLAHPLSTEFGVHHGLANAICLPAVMRFNAKIAAPQYCRVAAIFGVNTFEMTESEAAEMAVAAVSALIGRLKIPTRLREVGVPEDALPKLSEKAYEDSCHKTNPRTCAKSDLLNLYRESW